VGKHVLVTRMGWRVQILIIIYITLAFIWALFILTGCFRGIWGPYVHSQVVGLIFSKIWCAGDYWVQDCPSRTTWWLRPNPGWLSWFPVNLGQSWLLNLSGRHPTFFYSNRLAGDQAERIAKPLPFIREIQHGAGLDWDLCKPADKCCNCVPPQNSRRTLGRLALHAPRYCIPAYRFRCTPCMLWTIQSCKESGVIPHKHTEWFSN